MKQRIGALLLFVISGTGWAGSNVEFRLGGFWSQNSSEVGARSKGLDINTSVDFEADLRLERRQWVPLIELDYRLTERSSIQFSFMRLHRSGFVDALSEPFNLEVEGDSVTLQAGASLSSVLELDIYRLAYGYRWARQGPWQLTGIAGLHLFDVSSRFSGRIGALSQGHWSILPVKSNTKRSASPLPSLGLSLGWQPSEPWRFDLVAQGFAMEVGGKRGKLVNWRIEGRYRISERLALGAGYQLYEVYIDKRYGWLALSSELQLDVRFEGPLSYLQWRF